MIGQSSLFLHSDWLKMMLLKSELACQLYLTLEIEARVGLTLNINKVHDMED